MIKNYKILLWKQLISIFILILALNELAYAQTNDANPHVICSGSTKTYRVDYTENGGAGTIGSTYTWTINGVPTASIIAGQGSNSINVNWGTTAAGLYTDVITVVETNGGCSAPAVNLSIQIIDIPATPLVSSTTATCSADEASTISNYVGTLTYTFNPAGPTVGSGGVISAMTVGTSYTVTATNATCTSTASASFSNDPQLTAPATPTISSTAATCAADGSSAISNYNASLTYTFSPAGPSVGAGGVISGMTLNTPYTVSAGDGVCSSSQSASFNNAPQLPSPTTSPIFHD